MSNSPRRSFSNSLRELVSKTPVLGSLARWTYRKIYPPIPIDSNQFWVDRYRVGGDSGVGSYGKLAEFKASILNRFVAEQTIETVLEFGCGDGNQLTYAQYPQYHGFDISPEAVALCQDKFKGDATKRFSVMEDYAGESAELVLSLDVVFHLVEDHVFDRYMRTLYQATQRFVAIYSTNFDQPMDKPNSHVHHRQFTAWIDSNYPNCRLIEHVPNPYANDLKHGSKAEFFIYQVLK